MEKDYYKILGIPQGADKYLIERAYDTKMRLFDGTKRAPEIKEAYNQLMKHNKAEKIKLRVESIEENKKIAKKGKDEVEKKSKKGLIATILAVSLLGGCTFNKVTTIDKGYENLATAATLEPKEDEEEIPIINDETKMNELAEEIWTNICENKKYNQAFASNIQNKETVLDLIKWARHSNPEFTKLTSIRNEEAYSLLSTLMGSNNLCITKLGDGLEQFNDLVEYENELRKINKSTKPEECMSAYKALENQINLFAKEKNCDYAKVTMFLALTDYYFNQEYAELFKAARGGQSINYTLPNDFNQQLARDCNNIYENGYEGFVNKYYNAILDDDKEIMRKLQNPENDDVTNNYPKINLDNIDSFIQAGVYCEGLSTYEEINSLNTFLASFCKINLDGQTTSIKSREQFENIVINYYYQCINSKQQPQLSLLFKGNNDYAYEKLSQFENLYYKVIINPNDKEIARNLLRWLNANCDFYENAEHINFNAKENAPLIVILSNATEAALNNVKIIKNIKEADKTYDLIPYTLGNPFEDIDNLICSQMVLVTMVGDEKENVSKEDTLKLPIYFVESQANLTEYLGLTLNK